MGIVGSCPLSGAGRSSDGWGNGPGPIVCVGDGWVMWNPGSNYDLYTPALEKTFASRKK